MSGLDYTALDTMIIPCASKITLHDGSVVGGDESCVWDKKDVEAYMGTAFNIVSLQNQMKFQADNFGDETSIDNKSILYAKFTTLKLPAWTEAFVEYNTLVDEVDYIQIGQQKETDYTSIAFGKEQMSKYNTWPTKAEPMIYKFNSFWFELRQYTTVIERETYSLLDWAGDVGGLYEALYLICLNFIRPIATIVLRSELLSRAFKLVKGRKTAQMELSQIAVEKNIFRSIQICGRKKSRYRRKIERANSLIMGQLDVVRFVQQQRMLVLSALATMNSSQRNFRYDLS